MNWSRNSAVPAITSLEVVRAMSGEDRARMESFFGGTTPLSSAVTLMANDMHEHLGQRIAYARTNRVVPPWSEREG